MVAIAVLAVIAERFRLPFPILLVVAGLVLALSPRLPVVELHPDVVFLIILPPILFSAAWTFAWDEFRANFRPIITMAVGLVLATMICVGLAAHWLVPGMTLATALVLGAIVSPPDAVAATSLMRNLAVPRQLTVVLEGESLVNDSSGLVAYQFAVAAVVTGSFSMMDASLDFVWMSAGGVGIGLILAWISGRLHRLLHQPATQILVSLITPYIAYLAAEKCGVSGVLSVVAAGLYLGNHSHEILDAEARLQRSSFWGMMDYLLNGLVFILIGLQFPVIWDQVAEIPWHKLALILLVVCAVAIGVRFGWILAFSWISHKFQPRRDERDPLPDTASRIVASWAGMRGVVSLAAALALPRTLADGSPFPFRSLILFLTFGLIFVTLVFNGLTLPWLISLLGVRKEQGDIEKEIRTRLQLLERMVERINQAEHEAEERGGSPFLVEMREHYFRQIDRLRLRLTAEGGVKRDAREDIGSFLTIMNEMRKDLTNLRRENVLSEEGRQRIEYDIDHEERRMMVILRRMEGRA